MTTDSIFRSLAIALEKKDGLAADRLIADGLLRSPDPNTFVVEAGNIVWGYRDAERSDRLARLAACLSPDSFDILAGWFRLVATSGLDPAGRIGKGHLIALAPRRRSAHVLGTFVEGRRLWTKGRIEEAVDLFRQAGRLDQGDPPFIFGRNILPSAETVEALTSVSVDLPTPSILRPPSVGSTPTALVSCTMDYLERYGDKLVSSLAANSPGTRLHLHLIDPGEQGIEAVNSFIGRSAGEWISASWSTSGGLSRIGLSAVTRYLQVPRLLAGTGGTVVVLDMDLELAVSVEDIVRIMGAADVGLSLVPDGSPWNSVRANCAVFRPTKAGLRFALSVASYIQAVLARNAMAWMLDQISLWQTWRHASLMQPQPKVFDLRRIGVDAKGQPYLLSADQPDPMVPIVRHDDGKRQRRVREQLDQEGSGTA